MEKAISSLIVLAVAGGAIAGLVLGIWWCIWSLWCWVMPQVWATGPANLVHPSYWLFAGVWVLLGFVGRRIFGRAKDE